MIGEVDYPIPHTNPILDPVCEHLLDNGEHPCSVFSGLGTTIFVIRGVDYPIPHVNPILDTVSQGGA